MESPGTGDFAKLLIQPIQTDTNRYKRYRPIQADTTDTDRYNRYKPIQSLCEIDNGDAGAAEADVFVAEGGDVGVGFQLLADEGLEDAVACAVKDAEARGVELHGVVEEVGDGLQGFVCPHSSYVDLVLEFELAFATLVTGGG